MATKLLVADDSLTIQKIIRLALSNQGYEIQTVSDGNEALQQVALFRPEIILIDLTLPGKDAFELAAGLREMGPDFAHVKTVLLSSISESVDEERANTAGFHGRLAKPFDPASLRKVLSGVMDSPSNSSPAQPGPPPPPGGPQAAQPLGELEPIATESESFAPPPPPRSKPSFAPPPPPPAAPPSQSSPPTMPPPFFSPSGSGTIGDPIELEPIRDEPSMVLSMADETTEPSETVEFDDPPIAPPTFPPAPPPAFDPPPAPTTPEFSDIKHLTESTIRMSGLDEFQWSVQESAKKVGENTLQDLHSSQDSGIEPPPTLSDFGNSDFPLTRPGMIPPPDSDYGRLDSAPPPPPPVSSADYFTPPSSDGSPLPVSSEHLESLIQKQIEITLERLAQQVLPEIAEKVIKQEIRKMLLEQGAD